MSNILVTGANGQLGNEVRRASADSRDNYIFTDVTDLDITDPGAVREFIFSRAVDTVINCAAYTNVEKAEEEKEAAERINGQAVGNLAVACRERGARLIHISTDYVFRGDKNIPYREDDAVDPLGVYGKTKLKGEQAIEASGCRYLIFRTAWLYSKSGSNFVKTMWRLTAERDTLQVVFDQVGTPTYAGDLAELIFQIVENGRFPQQSGIYHFSNEGVCSWYDFAVEIARLSGHARCRILPCHSCEFSSRVTRPAFSVLDKTKVKRDFKVTIPHWRESLVKCAAELKELNNRK